MGYWVRETGNGKVTALKSWAINILGLIRSFLPTNHKEPQICSFLNVSPAEAENIFFNILRLYYLMWHFCFRTYLMSGWCYNNFGASHAGISMTDITSCRNVINIKYAASAVFVVFLHSFVVKRKKAFYTVWLKYIILAYLQI